MSRSVHLIDVLATAAVLVAAPAAAQVVRGTVIDNTTFLGVVGAGVTALDSAGKPLANVLTDSSGAFLLRPPSAGAYRLRVSALGYRADPGTRVELGGSDTRVVLRLVPDPVPIDSLTVMAQHRVPWLARAGFYRREAEGWGRFLDEKAIEAKAPMRFSDLLYGMRGVQVVCGSGTICDAQMAGATMFLLKSICPPTVVLDGYVLRVGGPNSGHSLILDELLNPANLAAVEVYPRAAGVPVQYAGYMSPCGTIIAWSRR